MAKQGIKKPNKGNRKKNFWSNFFEPVDDFVDQPEEYDAAEGEEPFEEKSVSKEPPMHLFSDEELDYDDKNDFEAVDSLTWDNGEAVVDDPYALVDDTDPLEETSPRGELPEEIQLFDDDGDEYEPERKKKRSGRTRIFKTGSATAARIHINETEESKRVEQAMKEKRERDAARKHEEYVQKQASKKKRKNTVRRIFSNTAFMLFLAAAVAVAMYYAFLLSDIIVVGNDKYTAEYITQEANLRLGQHMFTVNLDDAKERIEEDPYLQVDAITYIFPSRVRIEITERQEAAGIIGLDYNVIIDKNGYVLSMGGSTDLTGLIQVTGVSMTGFQLGERLGESDDFSTATLIELLDKLEEYSLMDSVSAIDLTTPLAITLTAKNGLKIHVGQPTDLDSKMHSLQLELPQFFSQNIYWGTLFLSAKGGTVYSPYTLSQLLDKTNDADTADGEGGEGEGGNGQAEPGTGEDAGGTGDGTAGTTPTTTTPPVTEDGFQG